MSNRYLVIMAGGKGERFWPQSRLRRPKHLLPIVGSQPMLHQTVTRVQGVVPMENIFILTNREQIEAVREVCADWIAPEQVIAEPVGRDTAPAVALATALVAARDEEAIFAMLPADHVIENEEAFRSVLQSAFEAAEQDVLVTIGIRPTHPATGYGYIHRGEQVATAGGRPVYKVTEFVEKPDLATAEKYLASGAYFWNGGMFVWRAAAVQSALAEHTPSLAAGLEAIRADLKAGSNLDAVLAERFPKFDKISIDYALMEKADNVVCIEATFDWDDVGEWPAVIRHYPKDEAGNVVCGGAVIVDGGENLVLAEEGHVVALLGVDDLIVVQTTDATLVCRKDRAQDIKKLLAQLGKEYPELT